MSTDSSNTTQIYWSELAQSKLNEFTLRDYQSVAVDKLADQESVFICDTMGLGKTVTTVALDSVRREQYHSKKHKHYTLVIAPLSGVVDSWVRHFRRARPDLVVKRIDPKNRERLYLLKDGEPEPDVVVVHHEACRPKLLGEWLADPYWGRGDFNNRTKSKFQWAHVIVDEAHAFKNYRGRKKTQRAIGLHKIRKVAYKTALTGSPIVNRPDEMWSILHWLYRQDQEWRSYWRFYEQYVNYIYATNDKGEYLGYHIVIGPKNSDELREKIEPFYIRRRKEEVLRELPDKYFTEHTVELSPKERKPYNDMKQEMLAWVNDQEGNEKPVQAPIVIAQLARLQQFALGTGGLNAKGDVVINKPSTKLDAIMDIVNSTDEQIVVFSQFKQFINLLRDELNAQDVSNEILTGETPMKFRDRMVQDFLKEKYRVFAATIRAGGVGIDLYTSSTCIFADRDWSPAINEQAEDRLHRLGQKNAVQIIDIVASDTVDLGKQQRLEQKWKWIKEILGE